MKQIVLHSKGYPILTLTRFAFSFLHYPYCLYGRMNISDETEVFNGSLLLGRLYKIL